MDHSSNDRPDGSSVPAPEPAEPAVDHHAEEDLKATEDAIDADVRRLADVESAKRRLDIGDPAVDRLSDEAVDLAERIHQEARAERQLSRDIR